MNSWKHRVLAAFDEYCYHTYPHCNGFADGSRSVVVGERREGYVNLWKLDLVEGGRQLIHHFPTDAPQIWFDVAAGANILVAVTENELWRFDLSRGTKGEVLLRAPEGLRLQDLPSITADGTRGLVAFQEGAVYGVMLVDMVAGSFQRIIEHSWWVNHAHFSPFDPQWIGYCHEGPCDAVADRVWAWHPEHCPHGRCVFHQAELGADRPIQLGHEVWSSHDLSIFVPAFGASPEGRRGLYQLFPDDGRPARLVSPGNRDWHCGVSPDGRWAVLDTAGANDLPGTGWEGTNNISDILLLNLATGARTNLARTHFTRHPWHPHPAFSLDSQSIIYSESDITANPKTPTGRIHILELAGRSH